jgi:hypothetical protein
MPATTNPPNATQPALPGREPTSRSSQRTDILGAISIVPTILVVVWASQVVTPSPVVHDVAKFAHLVFVIIGLGCVLAVDWYGIRWQLGYASLKSVVTTASALAVPTWLGLAGLLITGIFLQPDLTSPLTTTKIGLVTLLCFVGLTARSVHRDLAGGSAQLRVFRFAMTLAVLSQLCWWGAVVIGFLNRT